MALIFWLIALFVYPAATLAATALLIVGSFVYGHFAARAHLADLIRQDRALKALFKEKE